MDNAFTVVAGALSCDPARGRAAPGEYGIAAGRTYASIEELIARVRPSPPATGTWGQAVRSADGQQLAKLRPQHGG
jgi:hypothetical protein